MSVCDRYVSREEDAVEILNDGFLKVFKEIRHFTPAYTDVASSFKGWLRKIMVYTAIDYFRRNQKHHVLTELDTDTNRFTSYNESALDKIAHGEIIKAIQELSPAYRTVLNLFIIEGFSHEEIASRLGISTGTSKSNLSKARKQLQKILFNKQQIVPVKNAV